MGPEVPPSALPAVTPAPAATAVAEKTEIFPAADPPAPGYTTTEFWKSLMVTAVGLGILVFGVVKNREDAQIIGGSLAGFSTASYNVSRGIAKKRA